VAQDFSNAQFTALHPHLPATDLSLLINKVQAGELPGILLPALPTDALLATAHTPLSKVFTVESATFSLDSDPGALPDCLVQMSLNKVFIPLSMLNTACLTKVEHNEVKLK